MENDIEQIEFRIRLSTAQLREYTRLFTKLTHCKVLKAIELETAGKPTSESPEDLFATRLLRLDRFLQTGIEQLADGQTWTRYTLKGNIATSWLDDRSRDLDAEEFKQMVPDAPANFLLYTFRWFMLNHRPNKKKAKLMAASDLKAKRKDPTLCEDDLFMFQLLNNPNPNFQATITTPLQKIETRNLYFYISTLVNERDFEMITLKYHEGYRNKEIAKHVGLTEGSCNVQFFRIRKQLSNDPVIRNYFKSK